MQTFKANPGRRAIGQDGIEVFPIAYGCWRFAGAELDASQAKIEAALEYGINLFDHADIYGCDGGGQFGDAEELFGQVLARSPGLRDRMVIATKGGIRLGYPYDSSADYLRKAVDDSLRRLQIDVIDLYQIHRPDFLGHPAEVAETLVSLKNEGKIREVGVSNYTPSQFRALQAHLPFPIATCQPEFSCWQHSALRDGVLDQCLEFGAVPLAWSPFAGGRLGMTQEQASGEAGGDRLAALIGCLDEFADAQGVSRSAVALAWTMVHPSGVIPIIGTQRLERIRDSIDALKVEFDRPSWNSILVAAQGEPLP